MVLTSDNFPLMIGFLTFSVLFLLAFSLFQYVRENMIKRKVLRKINQNNIGSVIPPGRYTTLTPQEEARKTLPEFLNKIGKRVIKDKSQIPRAERIRFLRAGLRGQNVVSIYWGSKIFIGSVLCLGSLLLLHSLFEAEVSFFISLLISLYLGFLGFFLPNIWLRIRVAKRKRKIFEGFPDALDLVVVCLEAGMGLDQGMNRVGEKIRTIHKDISEELKLLGLELRAGMDRKDALRNLAARTDLEEVRNLVILMIQTERFGTSAATALRNYSENFRTMRYQKAEEKATKLPVKMIIPMIICLLPAMVTVILGPVAIQFYDVWVSTGGFGLLGGH